MPGEHAPGEGVGFAERHGLHPGPVQAEAEPADAAEQIKDKHRPLWGNSFYAAAGRLAVTP